ncbi:MAG: hypothetical protein FK733_07360 [Asgard group archaeon]|nr:hypothetical protein [Asgard group archaeon]
MTKKDLEYIPFYWCYTHGVDLMVIDNKILNFDDDFYNNDQFSETFILLCQLFNYEFTQKSIPLRFHKYLESKDNKYLKKKGTYQFGWGTGETEHTFTVEIIDNDEYPVIISDFDKTDLHGIDRYINNKSLTKLSAWYAFINFSNIVVGNTFNLIVETFNYDRKPAKKKLLRMLELPYKEDESIIDPKDEVIHVSYTYDYLHFLLNKIKRNEISLELILNLNGLKTLALLSEVEPVKSFINSCYVQIQDNLEELTGNEILLYYTLIIITQYGYGREYADNVKTQEKIESNTNLVKRIRSKLIELKICNKQNTSWH